MHVPPITPKRRIVPEFSSYSQPLPKFSQDIGVSNSMQIDLVTLWKELHRDRVLTRASIERNYILGDTLVLFKLDKV